MTKQLETLILCLINSSRPILHEDIKKLNQEERYIASLVKAAYNKGFEDGEWVEKYGNEEVDYIDY